MEDRRLVQVRGSKVEQTNRKKKKSMTSRKQNETKMKVSNSYVFPICDRGSSLNRSRKMQQKLWRLFSKLCFENWRNTIFFSFKWFLCRDPPAFWRKWLSAFSRLLYLWANCIFLISLLICIQAKIYASSLDKLCIAFLVYDD